MFFRPSNPFPLIQKYVDLKKYQGISKTKRSCNTLTKTKLSEDFVTFSKDLNMPVYIQCKASRGGITQHGKAVMNRSKEQVTRSIFYRCNKDKKNDKIISGKKKFVWISIIDGDWLKPKKDCLKYLQILQIAGYDRIFPSESIVLGDDLLPNNNCDFIRYLNQINCVKDNEDESWKRLFKKGQESILDYAKK